MEWLPSIGDISAGALLGLAVFMIFTDRLVTRKRLEEMRADRDRALDANDKLLAANLQTTRQLEQLLEQGRATNAILAALPRGAGDT